MKTHLKKKEKQFEFKTRKGNVFTVPTERQTSTNAIHNAIQKEQLNTYTQEAFAEIKIHYTLNYIFKTV